MNFSLHDNQIFIDFIWNLFAAVVTILGMYIAFNMIDLLASGLLIAGTVKVFSFYLRH